MKTLFLIIALFFSFALQAQKNYNPYASIGKKGKMLTLSNGKYNELELYDSLQRVGSVIVNMNTGKIYKLLPIDTIKDIAKNDPTVISRWYSLDPLQARYPSLSPYNFVGNSPLMFVDPDGRVIKPTNKDADNLFNVMAKSFVNGNEEKARALFGLEGDPTKGYKLGVKNYNENLKALGPDEFKKIAKDNGVSKDNIDDAYKVYLAVASTETIEIEVDYANKAATTIRPGEEGTKIVSKSEYSIDTKNSQFSEVRDKIINKNEGENSTFLPDERGISQTQRVKGIIVIDGSNKSVEQQSDVMKSAIKDVVSKDKKNEKK